MRQDTSDKGTSAWTQSSFLAKSWRALAPWLVLAFGATLLTASLEALSVYNSAPEFGLSARIAALISAFALDLLGLFVLSLPLCFALALLTRFLSPSHRAWLKIRLAGLGLSTLLASSAAWIGISLLMARTERFTDRPFALAVVAYGVPLLCSVAVVTALALHMLFSQMATRWPRLGRLQWSLWSMFTLLLALLLFTSWTLVKWGALLSNMRAPLWLILFVAFWGLLLVVAAWLDDSLRLRQRCQGRVLGTMVFATPLLGLLGAMLALQISAAAATPVVKTGGIARYVLLALRQLSDWDRDGAAALFAGGDCDELNSSRYPLADDKPGNGIDENCDGADAVLSVGNAEQVWYDDTPRSAIKPYNVIIICVDALRRDHMGFTGYQRSTTPYLDRLAAQSWFFEDTIAPSATTRQSVPVLLSGRQVSGMHWLPHDPVEQIADDNLMLAEILKQAGYRTIGVVDEWLPKFLPSIGQGFDFFKTAYGEHHWHDHGQHAGPFTNAMALEQLSKLDPKQKFFLYLHYEAPHHPYVPHPEVAQFGTEAVDLYDAEIAYADRYVGTMLEMIEAKGLMKDSIVVVFGDHGQEFMEHGQTRHSRALYAESVRVPLIVHVPGQKPGRFDGRSSLLDVVPTLLDLLGVRPPDLHLQGRSLLHRVFGNRSDKDRELLLELLVIDGGKHDTLKALYRGKYKLIWNMTTGEQHLFDVDKDALEQEPIDDATLKTELERALKARVSAATKD